MTIQKMNPQSPSKLRTDDDTEHSPKVRKLSTTPTKVGRTPSDLEVTESSQETNNEADVKLASRALQNLNLARHGVIPLEFDLESIYLNNAFEVQYRHADSDAATKCYRTSSKVQEDKNGALLWMGLINVFSEPVNCAYFNEEEFDKIHCVLSMSSEAQSLLARILKRKRGWHKVDSIQYPEIAADLKPVFRELVEKKIFEGNTENESIQSLLNLLQIDQLRSICKDLKVNHKATKPILIGELAKVASRKKSLFPGMKSPSTVLMEKISGTLGSCVRLAESSENLLDRVFILLMPNQDPKESMADAFRTLAEVKYGDKIYPPASLRRFPIFADRSHLMEYAEARKALCRMYKASEGKDWEATRSLGRLALDHLTHVLRKTEPGEATYSSTLPSHVRRFRANYIWAKVLWKSVEGFKKTKEGIDVAAEFLYSLLAVRGEHLGNPVHWYSELALIEMYHRKNLEASASITLEGLSREKLSDNDFAQLRERARKLLSRSKNISAETKERLTEASRRNDEAVLPALKPLENVIEARMVQGTTTGSKSTWSVNIGAGDVGYVRVEDVALLHYSRKGFTEGIHCEGALPVTLFAILLWNEIYQIPVPGAFVSIYQEAPLDLYGSRFLDNRREQIENKLSLMRDLDLETLSKIMSNDFAEYRHYSSLIHGKLFENPEDLRNFIECLGKNGVIGICEHMANNYNQWKSGFPDLAVWNPVEKKCRFVEVKGPGDSLSIKQKLWIQFLESLEIEVEVCIVKSTTIKYAT